MYYVSKKKLKNIQLSLLLNILGCLSSSRNENRLGFSESCDGKPCEIIETNYGDEPARTSYHKVGDGATVVQNNVGSRHGSAGGNREPFIDENDSFFQDTY